MLPQKLATMATSESSNNANVAKPRAAAAAGKTIEENYQTKSQREEILLRPDTYIGSIEKHTQSLWVYENGEMNYRPVTYVPGLYKIFDEILVNAADNIQRVLEAFFHLRLEYYQKRKDSMLESLKLEVLKLENKVNFIRGVVKGEIKLLGRDKADLVKDLKQRNFTPFPRKLMPGESEESSGSEYDYLSTIAGELLNEKTAKELLSDHGKIMEAIIDLENQTPRSLWLRDLDSLDKELDELDKAQIGRGAATETIRASSGAPVKAKEQAPKEPVAKKTTKKASESETTEASYSAMDTDNNVVAEVVKPKGRQGGAEKKAVAAKEDEMLDLPLAQYNFGSAAADSSKATETSKAIDVDDDDDDVVVEVAAPAKKEGRKPAASKALKQPAAPRKRKQVAATGASPEKKVRKMRSSPFNKKSSSVMSRLANEEEESSENVAGNSSSEKSEDVASVYDDRVILNRIAFVFDSEDDEDDE